MSTKILQYCIGSAILAYSIFSYISYMQIIVLQRNRKAINKLHKIPFLKKKYGFEVLSLSKHYSFQTY